MNRHLAILKDISNQIAHDAGLRSFPDFRQFSIDIAGGCGSPAELAAKALNYFCIEDGRYNSNRIGVNLAIRFLGETLRPPRGGPQRFKDLEAILNAGGRVEEILGWIDLWYD